MKNKYQIIDTSLELGIPGSEIYGDEFHYLDLYEQVGSKQLMTTFFLKEDSESYKKYGKTIIGTIHYKPEVLKKLKEGKVEGIILNKICISSPARELPLDKSADLKYYDGVEILDIEHIYFLPYQNEAEVHDTGEKKVPNIIEIEIDCTNLDPYELKLGYLVSKNNSGVELIQYEKEQFIGIQLGMRDGHIDSRILKHFGFSKDTINSNIYAHFYKVKEHRGTLSDTEKKAYSDIKSIQTMEAFMILLNEIKNAGISDDDLRQNLVLLKEIKESALYFEPNILLHGKKQIYWDINSYLHIVMRHIKDYQIGKFKKKTPFPYKKEDLNNLIEKVIQCIEVEYKDHVLKNPNSNFVRQGAMAVFFNGDYYNLRIDPTGRLIQFHALN